MFNLLVGHIFFSFVFSVTSLLNIFMMDDVFLYVVHVVFECNNGDGYTIDCCWSC
jgi:hypothetical protein